MPKKERIDLVDVVVVVVVLGTGGQKSFRRRRMSNAVDSINGTPTNGFPDADVDAFFFLFCWRSRSIMAGGYGADNNNNNNNKKAST